MLSLDSALSHYAVHNAIGQVQGRALLKIRATSQNTFRLDLAKH